MASYGGEAVGFEIPSGRLRPVGGYDLAVLNPVGDFAGGDDGSAWQWGPCGVGETMMPWWNRSDENQQHENTIFAYRTEICQDFQGGYCIQHKPNGKSTTCFGFHFSSQQRRPPVDPNSLQLLYWDVACPHWDENGTVCPSGNECMYAHNKEEISYHPAKYKTRRCNLQSCRGLDVCCFAHSEAEERKWAAERYSYWGSAGSYARGPAPAELTAADTDAWPLPPGESWQRPGFNGTSATATRHKHRFCASYPNVSDCRRADNCAFAHSRAEARTPLLTEDEEKQMPEAMVDEFFMYKFKTLWCPIGVQHDWQTCVYAHNYQDARRMVKIGYGPKPCPFWAKKDPSAEYAQRCPLGLRCPFAHGAKEQLYHPKYFRTVVCRDLRPDKAHPKGDKGSQCPRSTLCAFYHNRHQRRLTDSKDTRANLSQSTKSQKEKGSLVDDTNYDLPLAEENIPSAWRLDFLQPPFRDATPQDGIIDNLALEDVSVQEIGNADDWMPGDLQGGGGTADLGSGMPTDLGHDWWSSGANLGPYWEPGDAGLNLGASALWPEMLFSMEGALDADMSVQDSPSRGHQRMLGLGTPIKLPHEDPKYDSETSRFSLLSPKKLDGSPRKLSTDDEDAADDASTSAGGDFLASTGSLLCQAASSRTAPGTIGAAKKVGASPGSAGHSSASSSPWMLPSSQEPAVIPSWSPFAAHFDGLNSSSLWDSTKPMVLGTGGFSFNKVWDPVVSEPAA